MSKEAKLRAENKALRTLTKGLILSLQSMTERMEMVLRRAEESFEKIDDEEEEEGAP